MALRLFQKIGLIAGIHISYLFLAYGSGFFGLHLAYGVSIMLWLAASSIIAFVAYFWAISKSQWLATGTYRTFKQGASAVVATLISLYLGAVVAVNTYGT